MRFLIGLALCTPAFAQPLVQTCLEEVEAGLGLDLEVDDIGTMYTTQVERFGGNIRLLRRLGDDVQEEVIEARVSNLGIDETQHADLLLVGDDFTPWACYRHGFQRALRVARLTPNGWRPETVAEGDDVGGDCALVVYDGQMRVLFDQDGALMMGSRAGVEWAVEPVDAIEDRRVGIGVQAIVVGQNLYVAHRSDDLQARLRISRLTPNGWRTESIEFADQPHGVRPQMTLSDDNELLITHGLKPIALDEDSDAGLLLTTGRPGNWQTVVAEEGPYAGVHGAYYGPDGLVVVGRERQRSVLFGNLDGLLWWRGVPNHDAGTVLFRSDTAQRRRHVRRVRARGGPFGLPRVAYVDDRAAFLGEPGEAVICLYAPFDGDNDWIPDAIERELGTNPVRADTDGDGRTDGEEVLIDGTDPTRPPGEPEPDVGVPDMAIPDLAIPDAAVPDVAVPDAAIPDAAEPDAATPDAADPDAAIPDAAQPDVAEPDGAVPDVAAPDLALPDGATPDGADPDAAPDAAAPDVGPDVADPDARDGRVEPDGAVPDRGPTPDGATPDGAGPDAEPDGGSTVSAQDGCAQSDGPGWPLALLLVALGRPRRKR